MSGLSKAAIPAGPERESIARLHRFLKAHEEQNGYAPDAAYFLSGPSEHDRVELDATTIHLLKQVVEHLQAGRSVSILAQEQQLTTQQAAELLGVSRPTVVRLIESGDLPADVPGAVRRRLRLEDVLAYRERLRVRRDQFIAESSEAYADVEPGDVAEALMEARVAARQRDRS